MYSPSREPEYTPEQEEMLRHRGEYSMADLKAVNPEYKDLPGLLRELADAGKGIDENASSSRSRKAARSSEVAP